MAPRGPLNHNSNWDVPREPVIAMARMQQIGGNKFEDFKRSDLEFLVKFDKRGKTSSIQIRK